MNAPISWPWLDLVWPVALQVAGIFVVAVLAERWVKSGAWRRIVWQAAIMAVAIVAALEITGAMRLVPPITKWVAVKPAGSVSPTPVLALDEKIEPISSTEAAVEDQFRLEPVNRPVMETTAAATSAGLAEAASEPAASPVRPASPPTALWPVWIWLCGMALLAGRLLFAHAVLAWLRFRRHAMEDVGLLGCARDISARLGMSRKVRLIETAGLASPMAFGLAWLVIGLPEGFARRHSSERQAAMLLHELAHLANRDPAWYLAMDAVAAVLWWHPLVWWARRRFHAACEAAADEASLLLEEGPDTLAECLVELGKEIGLRRAYAAILVEGNGFDSSLGRRVAGLLALKGRAFQLPAPGRSQLWRWMGSAGLVLAIVMGTVGFRNRATAPPSTPTLRAAWESSLVGRVSQGILRWREQRAAKSSVDAPVVATAPSAPVHEADLNPGNEVSASAQGVDATKRATSSESSNRNQNSKSNDQDPRDGTTRFSPNAQAFVNVTGTNKTHAVETILRSLREMANRLVFPTGGPIHHLNGTRIPADFFPVEGGRQAITDKLNRIRIPELGFDKVPLSEALQLLCEECMRLDPDEEGLTFVIVSLPGDSGPFTPAVKSDGSGNPGVPLTATSPLPRARLRFIQPGAEPGVPTGGSKTNAAVLGIESAAIEVNPSLRNITLMQALDLVSKASDQPLKFSIEDFGVVIQPKLETSRIRIEVRALRLPSDESHGYGWGPPDFAASPSASPTNRPVSKGVITPIQARTLLRAMTGKYGIDGVPEPHIGIVSDGPAVISLSATNSIHLVLTATADGNKIHIRPRAGEGSALPEAILWDGQTGIYILPADDYRVSFLGDLPLSGRLAKTQPTKDDHHVILVSATILDAKGERLHSDEEIQKLIEASPKGQTSPQLKKENPSTNQAPSSADASLNERAMKIAAMIRDGRILFEQHRLDDAERLLKEVVKLDSKNDTAPEYLRLIQEARIDRELREREFKNQQSLAESRRPDSAGYLRTNTVQISPNRQKTIDKLNSIRIPEVIFDGLPLSYVVKFISDEARRLDPEKRGIPFLIDSRASDLPPTAGQSGVTATPQMDLKTVLITVIPALTNLTVMQVLDVISKVSKTPLEVSIEDHAVVLQHKRSEMAPLFTRVYKVDPITFPEGLRDATAYALAQGGTNRPASTNSSTTANADLRALLATAGFKFGTNTTNQAHIFYNDQKGLLMVRASEADLKIVEDVIVSANSNSRRISVEAWAAYVPGDAANRLGLGWLAQEAGRSSTTNRNPSYGIIASQQMPKVMKSLTNDVANEVVQAPYVEAVSGGPADIEFPPRNLILVPTITADASKIRLRWVAALEGAFPEAILWDGQTAMYIIPSAKSRTPFLGDLPMLGRLFRTEPTNGGVQLILVTATIVNPKGERLHSEEEIQKLIEASPTGPFLPQPKP